MLDVVDSVAFDGPVMARTIDVKIITEAFPAEAVEVSRVTGREAIGRLYEFEIELVARDSTGYDIEAMTGQRRELRKRGRPRKQDEKEPVADTAQRELPL